MIISLGKTHDFIKNDKICLLKQKMLCKKNKFANTQWKCVISEQNIFPLVCSKYLSSWTGLGKSRHVQRQSFGEISHVSGPKLAFWGDFITVRYHFCARKLMSTLKPSKNVVWRPKILSLIHISEPTRPY